MSADDVAAHAAPDPNAMPPEARRSAYRLAAMDAAETWGVTFSHMTDVMPGPDGRYPSLTAFRASCMELFKRHVAAHPNPAESASYVVDMPGPARPTMRVRRRSRRTSRRRSA